MNIPFLLKLSAKDYLWGGSRLNDDFNYNVDSNPFAEAWLCSTHPDGESTTINGENLSEVLFKHPDWLGSHPINLTGGKTELPILIKMIDAKSDLSVQVHPDDDYAKANENGSWGKTELWYVLDAKPNSELIYGFCRDVTPMQVKESINNGSIIKLLNHVPVQKNDLFYIESGTVHAIGAGCLIAEIQQNSNLTYRLYDYDRLGKDGKKRQLHIDKALSVANLSSASAPRQPMRVINYNNGCATELLSRCKYFQVERILLNSEGRKLAHYKTGSNSFHVMLCINGCGVLFGEKFMLNFFKGDCIFIPADSIHLNLHGQAQILDVSC